MAALAVATADAAAGRGGVLVVEGPAGIGKTALLDAARASAEEQSMAILSARGGELERELGFGLVRLLFESAVRRSGSEDLLSGQAQLATGLLGLDAGEHAAGAQPPTPAESVLAVLHGLYWVLAGLAAKGPLALLVDDAHWADPASARFFAYVARRLADLPVLLVVSSRPGGDAELLLRTLAAVPGARVLEPGALSEAATASLIRGSVPDADEAACRACHAATGGNALFVRELAHALAEEGLGATAQLPEWSPERVTRAVAGRLSALSPDAGALARAAAVLGQSATLRHAGELAGLPAQASAGAADELLTAGILTARRPLEFVHPIVGTAVGAGIPPGQAAAAHARAARLLAAEHAPAERIAVHVAATQPAADEWAYARLTEAGQEALARGAPEAAVYYLRRALEEPPPGEATTHLLLSLAGAEALSFGTERAAELIRRAFASATDVEERLQAAFLFSVVQTQVGAAAESVELLVRLLDELGEDGDLAPMIEAKIVNAARYQTSTRTLVAPIARRLRASSQTGERRPPVVLAAIAADMLMAGEPVDGAVRLGRAALEGLAESSGLADLETLLVATRTLFTADVFDISTQRLDEALDGAAQRGAALEFALLATFRSDAAYRRGDLVSAEAHGRNAYAISLEHAWPMGLPACAANLAQALIARGELEEAARVFDEAGLTEDAATMPDYYTHALLLHVRGRLRVARGQVEQGLQDLLESGRRLTAHGELNPALVPWRAGAALALFRMGDARAGETLAAEDLQRARDFGAPRAIGMALRGLAAVLDGPGRLELLHEAVDVLAASEARFEHACALSDLGTVLLANGDAIGAREVLRAALDLADICGAAALEESVIESLRTAGARPRRARLKGPRALTPSERRVADMAVRDMSNREIAESLFVTVRTVEFHLAGTYRKLGISSRHMLADALRDAASDHVRASALRA